MYDKPSHETRAVRIAERVAKRVLNPISTALDFTVTDAATARPLLASLGRAAKRFPTALLYSAGLGGWFAMDPKVSQEGNAAGWVARAWGGRGACGHDPRELVR